MMFLDTNIIARSLQRSHPHHQPALDAMRVLAARDREQFFISPQVLTEFYAIATRSTNGLGLAPHDALVEMENLKQRFQLLPELPTIFPRLEQLLASYHPTNRHVFDLRHVAVMLTHGIPKILTFNDADFRPFAEIQPLNPFDVLGSPRL
jgi:predicted nucleic acid-binding protein